MMNSTNLRFFKGGIRMKNPFTQKTVYNGTSMSEFNAIRNILELNHIEYKYKTTDLNHNSYLGSQRVTRSMGGNFKEASDSLLYEILVDKEDYDNALGAIKKK